MLKQKWTQIIGKNLVWLMMIFSLILFGCSSAPDALPTDSPTDTSANSPTSQPTDPPPTEQPAPTEPPPTDPPPTEAPIEEESAEDISDSELSSGCPGDTYPDPATSPYVLPFVVGEKFNTGLTNCSSSFHGTGQPDQHAFDFNMPVGTPFVAARAGTVIQVVEDAPSGGGGIGNFLIIDHGDDTFAFYLHSPADGIDVEIGDEVEQGQALGVTGRSGLAGYPHLHFIVVNGPPEYPYEGLAISFSNASPLHTVLQGSTEYEALPTE